MVMAMVGNMGVSSTLPPLMMRPDKGASGGSIFFLVPHMHWTPALSRVNWHRLDTRFLRAIGT